MDESVGHKLVLLVDSFDVLGANVLSLRKLEDILLAVDDLEVSVTSPHTDVTCHEPSVFVQTFSAAVQY